MLKQIIEIHEVLDSAFATGSKVLKVLEEGGMPKNWGSFETIKGDQGQTDFVKITIPGTEGKIKGGQAPTLGLIGRLGGIGARPERVGLVSDGDGAIVVLACALKLVQMQKQGDFLPGDVIITTHVAPHAPTKPHDPVPFMGSPVDMAVMNKQEVDPEMDAILSVDTTKGNRILNHKGFAISPTVKEGWILRVSEDLVSFVEWTSGKAAVILPITMQDITPYGNGVYHVNSILQPAVGTKAPVVGVAITTETATPGCATGASHEVDLEVAARFCLETAKAYGQGQCQFYNEQEFENLVKGYGSMEHLQKSNPYLK